MGVAGSSARIIGVMGLVQDLTMLLGDSRVTVDRFALHLYSTDAGASRGHAEVVVFPETTAEVAEVVLIASRHEVPIVPRGAGTGLAAGAVPNEGGIVISTKLMDSIEEVDIEDRTAWVGPGVINLDLSAATRPLGLHFAPDPSSQAVCTVGGNVANNSGGPHCLAEGSTVAHVLAVEVVLTDGEVVTVGSAAPDPIGLDLRGVLVGSEGTLGLVTRVLVRLLPNPPDVRTMLLAFDSVEAAASTVSGVIAAGVVPAALEMMDQRMAIAVENWLHAGLPVEAAALLLAEVVGESAAVEAEAEVIARVASECGAASITLAADEDEREILWKGRKGAFGAVAQTAPDYYLHDTVVPRTKLVETLAKVQEIADRHRLVMMNVFHAGDGNLHPLIAFDSADADEVSRVQLAAKEMVEVCVSRGGVLSGEHGIGLEKRDMMPLLFTPTDLDAQARLKECFDPAGMFNPSKVLPLGSRCFDLGSRPIPEGAWV
jgi:glycolate oxidase